MTETWAAVLAISVAIMALVQLAVIIGLAVAWRQMKTAAATTQQQIERAVSDMKLNVGTVTARMNAVADDVRGVTSRIQQVATTVSDGVQVVEHSVKSAGQRVADTVDQVPSSVKKGVPAGLATLAAIRTVQRVRSHLRDRSASRRYERDYSVDEYAS